MSKGRRPLPDEIKRLNNGETPQRPTFDDEQEVHPPEWLDDDARREWDRVAPTLVRNDLLRSVDVAALAAYCTTYVDYVRCVEGLRDESLDFRERMAIRRAIDSQLKQLRAWVSEFGFTPSSRGRMEVPETQKRDDALDAFNDFLREN